jgi:cytoplasmic iron level regulating protein YaaA (DUF328/UPF0246 family)
MLIVLSPAKTLDFDTPAPLQHYTQPAFLEQSQQLNQVLRGYDAAALGKLMGISEELARLNERRNHSWTLPFDPGTAKQALFAFRGDVYTGLEADSFSAADLDWAQQHLRILSGLYGLLRPLDLMQPYRLEMGTRLPNPVGKDLYAFWGASLTEALNAALAAQGDGLLVNLASEEYFSAVKPALLQGRIVTPVFKDWKNGRYKIISFYAKKARGRMAAWIIRERLQDAAGLCNFAEDGYCFDAALSSENELVFCRRQD